VVASIEIRAVKIDIPAEQQLSPFTDVRLATRQTTEHREVTIAQLKEKLTPLLWF
jgi:hypothetical protein